MTDLDLKTSFPELLQVLRDDLAPAPPEVRERVAARLADGLWGLSAVTQLLPTQAPTTPLSPFQSWLRSRAFAVAVSLPAGAVLGASAHAWLAPVATPRVELQRPASSATVPASSVEPPPGAPPVENGVVAPTSVPLARLPVPDAPALSNAPGVAGLDGELLLLEQARTSLSEGDVASTLARLRQHHARYPGSSLEQEREALMIKVLVAAGRHDEARTRAARFLKRFPSSLLRSSVEQVAGSIP